MKKYLLLLLFHLNLSILTLGQVSLDYYLPANITFNNEIPTPKSVIGHDVGEWHISHDKLVQYMYALAEASDRIEIEEYARSHENRPLLTLKISSPKNIENLEKIRKEHLKLSDYEQSPVLDLSSMPTVLYLGYSIHGNEPSGSNASLLVAYYLAAAQGEEIEKWLDESIILLDPSYNPDGLNRFASWVNGKKSLNLVSDPNNIEQNEPWPRGRTNHYWFDLNRDWLPVQHPESQGRIRNYHHWKPNVLTDHHEMGTNGTFFFQPGIPSRNNPLTPKNNFVLTEKIGNYHADALDQIGSLYYSKESFDDFYVGKGSTYPDVNGCIGILFEQASSRGHSQKSVNGVLSFPFTIKNHFTTSLSTLKAGTDLKQDLLTHQRDFYQNIPDLVDKEETKAYVFNAPDDYNKLKAFMNILATHQIQTYQLNKNWNIFSTSDSYIIPLKQNQFRMIQTIFEQRTSFQDSLFYDVSAWTLPLAFDMNFATVKSKKYSSSLIGNLIDADKIIKPDLAIDESSYAYAFHWLDTQSPALLNDILKLGLRAKVATESWTSAEGDSFERGSIIIPVQNQNLAANSIYQQLISLSAKHNISISGLASGNSSGFQLGSPKFEGLSQPKPILVVGDGVSPYDAGEVWHLLDQRIGMALPMITQKKINSIKLTNYNTLILVGGSYGTLTQEKIKTWVQNGGRIIALKSGAKWTSEAGFSKMKYKKIVKDSSQTFLAYNKRLKNSGAQRIGGAIFESKLDLTHPLCFGFQDENLALFKRGLLVMEQAKNPYAQPVRYSSNPLLAGYISNKNLNHLPNTAAVGVSALGSGLVISMTDNPNFRGYWYGTNRLFLNALFFGSIIESGSAR